MPHILLKRLFQWPTKICPVLKKVTVTEIIRLLSAIYQLWKPMYIWTWYLKRLRQAQVVVSIVQVLASKVTAQLMQRCSAHAEECMAVRTSVKWAGMTVRCRTCASSSTGSTAGSTAGSSLAVIGRQCVWINKLYSSASLMSLGWHFTDTTTVWAMLLLCTTDILFLHLLTSASSFNSASISQFASCSEH